MKNRECASLLSPLRQPSEHRGVRELPDREINSFYKITWACVMRSYEGSGTGAVAVGEGQETGNASPRPRYPANLPVPLSIRSQHSSEYSACVEAWPVLFGVLAHDDGQRQDFYNAYDTSRPDRAGPPYRQLQQKHYSNYSKSTTGITSILVFWFSSFL